MQVFLHVFPLSSIIVSMIRTILTCIFVFLFLVLSIPILLIELLVKKLNPMAADMSQLRIVQWAFGVVEFLSGAKTTVTGLENIPSDTPVLFVSNHQSIFDIVISYRRMPYRTGYVSKKTIEKVPLLSHYMRRLYCLFIDRDNLRSGMQMIMDGIANVKKGVSVFICPEGTRNKSGDELNLGEFHDGSFRIASKTGCPVIPVAIHNTENILEKHIPYLKKTRVALEFGKPIYIKDLPADMQKKCGAYFRNEIIEMLKKYQEG